MHAIRWGIFGAGAVAAKFVLSLKRLPNASVGLVASRTRENAEAFGLR